MATAEQSGIPIYGTGANAGKLEGTAPNGSQPYFLPNTSPDANPNNSQWAGASNWKGTPTLGGSGQNNLQASPSTVPISTTPQPGSPALNSTQISNTNSPQASGQIAYQTAQDSLNKGGLTGQSLTQATNDLKTKYNIGLQAAKGSGQSTPDTGGTGAAGVSNFTPVAPPTNPIDSVLANDPGYQQIVADRAAYMSSQNQQQSLTQQYRDISASLGLPQINVDLMNTKNIIDGSENDIRNEITKAGGFATQSQVLGMTDARNKVLIQNYNNLLAQKNDAVSQLSTLTSLAAQDRSYAQQQLNNTMQFDQQLESYRDKAINNAQGVLSTMQKSEGWDGIYKAAIASGDPNAIARINQTMGSGFDLTSLAAQDAKDRAQNDIMNKLDLKGKELSIQSSQSSLANSALDRQIKQQTLNDANGLPNPAKAGRPGYTAQGIKLTPSLAGNQISNQWQTQGVLDPSSGFVPPSYYNYAKSQWVEEGLSSADFDSILGRYQSPYLKTQYNQS